MLYKECQTCFEKFFFKHAEKVLMGDPREAGLPKLKYQICDFRKTLNSNKSIYGYQNVCVSNSIIPNLQDTLMPRDWPLQVFINYFRTRNI